MKITFLGTNGWYTTHTGNTACILAETDDFYLILDAGSGFYKLERLITDPKKPVFLFLSHLHLDHIDGLQVLSRFFWPQGLTVLVGKGMRKELKQFMRAPFMPDLDRQKTKVTILEPNQYAKTGLPVTVLPLAHTVPTLGLRLNYRGTVLAYATDTGYCDNLIALAHNADLLITESSLPPGPAQSLVHMTPQQAARAAAQADAKTLALIHFKADVYADFEDRDRALVAAGRIFPHTGAPYDGDRLEL